MSFGSTRERAIEVTPLAVYLLAFLAAQELGADMHAHPSRFHRADVPRITNEEIARYQRGGIVVVVCNISTDTPYRGGYIEPDGAEIATGNLRPEPGEPWTYTLDRLERILKKRASKVSTKPCVTQAIATRRSRKSWEETSSASGKKSPADHNLALRYDQY